MTAPVVVSAVVPGAITGTLGASASHDATHVDLTGLSGLPSDMQSLVGTMVYVDRANAPTNCRNIIAVVGNVAQVNAAFTTVPASGLSCLLPRGDVVDVTWDQPVTPVGGGAVSLDGQKTLFSATQRNLPVMTTPVSTSGNVTALCTERPSQYNQSNSRGGIGNVIHTGEAGIKLNIAAGTYQNGALEGNALISGQAVTNNSGHDNPGTVHLMYPMPGRVYTGVVKVRIMAGHIFGDGTVSFTATDGTNSYSSGTISARTKVVNPNYPNGQCWLYEADLDLATAGSPSVLAASCIKLTAQLATSYGTCTDIEFIWSNNGGTRTKKDIYWDPVGGSDANTGLTYAQRIQTFNRAQTIAHADATWDDCEIHQCGDDSLGIVEYDFNTATFNLDLSVGDRSPILIKGDPLYITSFQTTNCKSTSSLSRFELRLDVTKWPGLSSAAEPTPRWIFNNCSIDYQGKLTSVLHSWQGEYTTQMNTGVLIYGPDAEIRCGDSVANHLPYTDTGSQNSLMGTAVANGGHYIYDCTFYGHQVTTRWVKKMANVKISDLSGDIFQNPWAKNAGIFNIEVIRPNSGRACVTLHYVGTSPTATVSKTTSFIDTAAGVLTLTDNAGSLVINTDRPFVFRFANAGSVYTDVSSAAWAHGGLHGLWNFFPNAGGTLNDAMVYGSKDQFGFLDITDVNGGVQGAGGAVAWEYWNGSTWAALTGVTDGTSGFTAALGTDKRVSWTVPGDWATTSLGGSAQAYFIRARVTTAYTTEPKGDWGRMASSCVEYIINQVNARSGWTMTLLDTRNSNSANLRALVTREFGVATALPPANLTTPVDCKNQIVTIYRKNAIHMDFWQTFTYSVSNFAIEGMWVSEGQNNDKDHLGLDNDTQTGVVGQLGSQLENVQLRSVCWPAWGATSNPSVGRFIMSGAWRNVAFICNTHPSNNDGLTYGVSSPDGFIATSVMWLHGYNRDITYESPQAGRGGKDIYAEGMTYWTGSSNKPGADSQPQNPQDCFADYNSDTLPDFRRKDATSKLYQRITASPTLTFPDALQQKLLASGDDSGAFQTVAGGGGGGGSAAYAASILRRRRR